MNVPIFLTYLYYVCPIVYSQEKVPNDTFTLEDFFKNLIHQNPTVILLDDKVSDLEFQIRKALEENDNSGSVVYILTLGQRNSTPKAVL